MTIRTFIFCDACNPDGIRIVNTDLKACACRYAELSWYEGYVDEAVNQGWTTTREGFNLCPKCQKNGLGQLLLEKQATRIKRAQPAMECV